MRYPRLTAALGALIGAGAVFYGNTHRIDNLVFAGCILALLCCAVISFTPDRGQAE